MGDEHLVVRNTLYTHYKYFVKRIMKVEHIYKFYDRFLVLEQSQKLPGHLFLKTLC